jgi:hypothetical protein
MSWNYTTWLNIVFLILAAVLVVRFIRTGGLPMLRMMGGAPGQPEAGDGHQHHVMPDRPGGSEGQSAVRP